MVLGALGLGCGGDVQGEPLLSPRFGALQVPLAVRTASGARYRLLGSLELDGREHRTIELGGEREAFETALRIGPYQATLLDGWALVRSFEGVTEVADATLTSPNPSLIVIDDDDPTSLRLRFRVDGAELALGGEAGAPPAPPASEGDPGPSDDGRSEPDDAPSTPGSELESPSGGPIVAAACVEPQARCASEWAEEAADVVDTPLCLRATTVDTPLGTVDACQASTCASGALGCELIADTSATTVEADADGTLSVAVVAELSAGSVEVALAPFGDPTCRIGVAGVIRARANAAADDDGGGGVQGFLPSGLGVDLDGVELAVLEGDERCSALTPLLADVRASLTPRVAEALATTLDARLDRLASELACVRCDAECGVRCTPR